MNKCTIVNSEFFFFYCWCITFEVNFCTNFCKHLSIAGDMAENNELAENNEFKFPELEGRPRRRKQTKKKGCKRKNLLTTI